MNLDRVIAVRNSKTVFRDGDRCIKVFNCDYSKADVLNEALNQARIEQTGINVPEILEVTTFDGKWSIVSKFIKGKTLSQLMEEDASKADEYLEMLVDLQFSVHEKTMPLLNSLKDRLRRRIVRSELTATKRYQLCSRLESMPKHNKICHGDFIPSNILVSEKGTPYILDWSHVSAGNASADAASTYLSFCLNSQENLAEKYLDLFCQKSGTEKVYVKKWIPIVAASLSVSSNENTRQKLLDYANEEGE